MSIAHLITVAMLAAIPLTVIATEDLWPPDELDAAADVPASIYTSALRDYRGSSEFPESPDRIWHAINANVGMMGGHAGHTQQTAASDHWMPSPGQTEPTTAEVSKPRQKKMLKPKSKAKPKLQRQRLHYKDEDE
jgi:hypothetical protein